MVFLSPCSGHVTEMHVKSAAPTRTQRTIHRTFHSRDAGGQMEGGGARGMIFRGGERNTEKRGSWSFGTPVPK